MKNETENKMVQPKEKKVKVKLRPGRAAGGGKPGDVIEVSAEYAEELIKTRYAEKVG